MPHAQQKYKKNSPFWTVEFVATVKSIYEGVVHPTINLEHHDPDCDLGEVAEGARQMPIRAALKNSLGFGGT
ncbi:MAG: hypothetical protein KGZ92_05785 [Firmicutes bacterium]|nr:hypothetical protein [Dethiobacter sp.]MBS3888799.1 hypothetical protein [Bacillota bacterium]MBS4054688.1 hypothetical protein [Thermaerobacter sp.]